MRYTSILPFYAAALVCVTLLGAGCTPTVTPVPNAVPTSTTPIVVPTSTPPATSMPLSIPNYPEATSTVRTRPLGNVCDPQNFICVPRTLVNSSVSSPVTASGTAIAFENTFRWALLGPANQLIDEGTLMANAPDVGQPGPFTLSQAVDVPSTYSTGTLRFYEASAKDGTPIHVLNIPVRF